MVELSGQLMGQMQQGFGGDTLNTAVYLKRVAGIAAQVAYVTAMGQDSLSQAIIERWLQADIDCQFVLRDPSRNAGLYLIENDANGERSFHYWRNQAAARYLLQHPDIEAVLAALKSYDLIYLSGISLAILPAEDRGKLIDFLIQAKAAGVTLAFDGNYRARLWASTSETQAIYKQLYALCDIALLTFDDEAALWGDSDVEAAFDRLGEYQINTLVLKVGGDGCYLQHANQRQHIATTPVAHVVDTTAAGDSFNAGFLAAWLMGHSHEQAAGWGNQLAGQVIQQSGAIVPTAPLV
ncbi:sugar kinase [Shewanella avicenniae]|uniref:Sugar kinase n=2 Tax=Shewanella avicenniae TaxID=2814294 RepID=A0ABX7QWQ0_9GAMM|nr:sugar kinase [Shewanella avicenniae]